MSLSFSHSKNCFELHNLFLIDNECIPNIINLKAIFDFSNFEQKNNEWYVNNNKLSRILFSNKSFDYIEYSNENTADFRIKNINFKNYIIEKPTGVEIIECGSYLKINEGRFSGQIRNMYWKVSNPTDSNNEVYYLMSCKDLNKKTIFFKFDVNSLEKVLNVYQGKRHVWHAGKNGYVKTSYINSDGIKVGRYLHQHLMDYYGNGLNKNTKTIDHINRDKLDNRLSNLRLATQSEQNINTDKRNRKCNAKELPDDLTQDMIPKYVVYYNECYNKEKDLYRDFFKIEKHPKYERTICSSKSNKVSIHDKLKEIKDYLKKIEDNNNIIKEISKLPTGIRHKILDNKEELILDYKIDNVRYGLKMKCDNSKTFDENYKVFKNKIIEKYPNYKI